MRSVLIACLILILIWQCPVANAQKTPPDISAAYDWLELLDNEKFFQSWQYASDYFKNTIEAADWDKILSSTRTKLGKLQQRKLVAYSNKTKFANLPEGSYLVLKFTSQFQVDEVFSEILVLTIERGQLKVAAYFIQ